MSTIIDFSGKVALVTGAARGIGEAGAKALAEAGASVLLVDILPEVEQTAQRLAEATGAKTDAFVADLTDSAQCEAMVKAVVERFGRLDFAFNNAGIGGEPEPFHEMSDEHWQRVLDINLNSMFYCIKREIPAMLESGGGVIINTSSVCGKRSWPHFAHYNASKHAVVSLSKQVAVEYGGQGLRCVAVGPGYIETAMTAKSTSEIEGLKELFESKIPMGRSGTPKDIGNVVRLLCSDDAGYINGAFLPVDGGMLEM